MATVNITFYEERIFHIQKFLSLLHWKTFCVCNTCLFHWKLTNFCLFIERFWGFVGKHWDWMSGLKCWNNDLSVWTISKTVPMFETRKGKAFCVKLLIRDLPLRIFLNKSVPNQPISGLSISKYILKIYSSNDLLTYFWAQLVLIRSLISVRTVTKVSQKKSFCVVIDHPVIRRASFFRWTVCHISRKLLQTNQNMLKGKRLLYRND